MLEGRGKDMRHIKTHSVKETDEDHAHCETGGLTKTKKIMLLQDPIIRVVKTDTRSSKGTP